MLKFLTCNDVRWNMKEWLILEAAFECLTWKPWWLTISYCMAARDTEHVSELIIAAADP